MATNIGKIGSKLSGGGLSELRRRLLCVIFGIVIFRLGAYIPVPGLDPARLSTLFGAGSGGLLNLFNMFSGGALSRMTIFALGVMPYISASIIIQMFGTVSPKMQQLKKEGEAGRHKINQYTRYAAVGLSMLQAVGIAKWLVGTGIAITPGFNFYFVSIITLTTGTMFLMWLGEQMTERGIGNGISLIIFASIVSRFPAAVAQVFNQVYQGQMQLLLLLLLIGLVLLVTAFVVFMEQAQRKITINYAKRLQGRKLYAAQSSHLPLKLNMAGVIPPIFAQSVILFPAAIAKFFGTGYFGWLNELSLMLSPGQPVYMVIYAAAVIFFSFFYTALVFNPKETADNLKRSGAFVPGIRPGVQTARYIDKIMTRLTVVGAIYLTIVSLMPQILILAWHVPFYFGGTSLLIIVVVVMDFIAQVQAHLMSRQYESMMKKSSGGRSGSKTSLF
jgi:preprotein translocase subunit SecY